MLESTKICIGMVPLENIFDGSNAFKISKVANINEQVVEVNVGSREIPSSIEIYPICTLERNWLVGLLKAGETTESIQYNNSRLEDLCFVNSLYFT